MTYLEQLQCRFCECSCKHEYGDDLGQDCTDEWCGYCGESIDG